MSVEFPKKPHNPYAAPDTDFDDELSDYHTEPFYSRHGRIGRVRFLSYTTLMNLILMAIFFVLGVIMAIITPALGLGGESIAFAVLGVFWLLSSILGLYAYFVPAIRRLNDLDYSGWLSLLLFIPFVNLLFWLYLVFAKGSDGENRYGIPAEPPTTLHIVLGCFFPLFGVAIIGILAAIALPAYQDYVMRSKSVQEQYSMQMQEFMEAQEATQ